MPINPMKKYFLYVLLLPFTSFAQTNNDLNHLINQVLDYSPLLKSQKTFLRVGEERTKIQESAMKANVAYETGITRLDPVSKPNFGGNILQFQPNMNYSTAVVANQVLFDWGKNAMAVEKSRLENKLTQAQIEAQAFTMAYQIATLYHQIAFFKQALGIQQTELARMRTHMEVVNQQIKLGEAIELDAMNQRIRLQNQETKITETEMQIAKLIDFLSTQAGKDAHGFLNQSALTLTKASEALHPSIVQLMAEEAVYQQESTLQGKANAPFLAGIASLGIKNGYVPRINGVQPDVMDDFRLNSILGLKLTVPIYSGKRDQFQQNIAKIQQERIAFQKEETNQKLEFELRQGVANLATIEQKLRTQQLVVEQAKYAFNLANSRYKQGTIKQLELDQVQNTAEEASLQLVNFQYQLTIQQLDLMKTKGVQFWIK